MKAVRDTSAVCYRDLQHSLSRREQIVMDALASWGSDAPTSYELVAALHAFDVNSVRPRLTALLGKGCVVNGEKRKCRITGKSAYTWAIAPARAEREPEAQRLNF